MTTNSVFQLKRNQHYLLLLLLLGLLYFPLFHHIAQLPLRIWDEARLAHNAYEMYKEGHVLVPHFEGKPDMWNLKPPFLVWMQAAFMHMLGPGELAVRLPSALAGLLTCLILFFFFERRLSMPWAGFMAAMVLVTTQGFVHQHATRTGDYDAMIAFWLTLSSLVFFSAAETGKKSHLYTFWIALGMGVLTKSIVGLFMLPALGAYLLWSRKWGSFWRQRHTWYGMMVFIGMVAAYYLGREAVNPGYLQAVWDNELGGRYSKVVEAHHGDFWFYLTDVIRHDFQAWYLLFPAGLAFGLAARQPVIRRFSGFLLCTVVCFFLVISTAKTKIEWYNVPLYPFLAAGVAIFLYMIAEVLLSIREWQKLLIPAILLPVVLFLVFTRPYAAMIDKTYMPEEYPHEVVFYRIGHYLQDARDGKVDLNGFALIQVDYAAHNSFYINIMRDDGVDVRMGDYTQLQPGDKVVVFQDHVKNHVMERFEVETLDTWYEVQKWRIVRRLQDETVITDQ